jgi:hypothetical protein
LSKIRFEPKASEFKCSIIWGVPVKDLNIRLWKLEGYKVNAVIRAISIYVLYRHLAAEFRNSIIEIMKNNYVLSDCPVS